MKRIVEEGIFFTVIDMLPVVLFINVTLLDATCRFLPYKVILVEDQPDLRFLHKCSEKMNFNAFTTAMILPMKLKIWLCLTQLLLTRLVG